MKRAILLLLLTTLSGFAGESWPGLPFAEVRAYAWPDDKKNEAVILPGMTLKPGVTNKDGAVLTPGQVRQLRTAITGRHPSYAVAACFIPHKAFVFFDAAGKPVACVEVCFACRGIRAQPKGAEIWVDNIALATIFDAHKLPMGPFPDLAAFKRDYLGK
jgi:hypothetical protein